MKVTSASLGVGTFKGLGFPGSGSVRAGGNCFSRFCCKAPASTAAEAKAGKSPGKPTINRAFARDLTLIVIKGLIIH